MLFDTHCHLNFKSFKKTLPEAILRAKNAGVDRLVVPGTDLPTSRQAVAIAGEYDGVYAAVGIHPHHVYKLKAQNLNVKIEIQEIEKLLIHPKVVAIGEVGLDKYQYQNTKYGSYSIDEEFVKLQENVLGLQIKLAVLYQKTLILHNREAIPELVNIIEQNWDDKLSGRAVLHCCEPDRKLLDFALNKNLFIGVDGDVTFNDDKARFVMEIPLERLVLETDSPYLLPEPLRGLKQYPNEPKNITVIADKVASILNKSREEVDYVTYNNSLKLFGL